MKVYQVLEHGLTTGRDSGYPMTNRVGPLFATKRGAQDEADRLLATLKTKTMQVTQINPTTGTYDFSNRIEKPVFEVVVVEPLTQSQADERQQGFRDKAQALAEERAARLEAEAAKIRSAWKDGYA